MAKGKRTSKTSKGIHGGGGKMRGLSPLQKVLMGKGMLVHAAPKRQDTAA